MKKVTALVLMLGICCFSFAQTFRDILVKLCNNHADVRITIPGHGSDCCLRGQIIQVGDDFIVFKDLQTIVIQISAIATIREI